MKKLNKNFIRIAIILFIFINHTNAKTYYCPLLPFKAKIGDVISNNWQVKYDEQEQPNIIKQLHLRYVGKKYDFQKWFALTSSGDPKLYYIGCCSVVDKKNALSLCVQRRIKAFSCEFNHANGIEKFICD